MERERSAGSDAYVFASDPDARRDIQIFLRRSCGLEADTRELPRADDGVELDARPQLIVVCGFGSGELALALVRQLRRLAPGVFILYLAGPDTQDEAGDAFAAGADDVQRGPLSLRELGLRLRARLGVELSMSGGRDGSRVPQVLIDHENCLHAAGLRETVQLTRAEADLMAVLIRSGGEIVSRDELARKIDQAEWEYGDRRFDVHVANIRKKLRQSFGARYVLRSIRFKGYVFCEDASDSAS